MDDKELETHLVEQHNKNPVYLRLCSDNYERFRITGLTVMHQEDHKRRQSELDHDH
jgi:hypothetical protein